MRKVLPGECEVVFSQTFKLLSDEWWAEALRKSDGLALRRCRRVARLHRWPFFRIASDWRLDRLYRGGPGYPPIPFATFRDEKAAVRLMYEICSAVEAMMAEWDAAVDALPFESDPDADARG